MSIIIIAIVIAIMIIITLIIFIFRRATAQLATQSTVSMSQRASPTALRDQDLQHRFYLSSKDLFNKVLIFIKKWRSKTTFFFARPTPALLVLMPAARAKEREGNTAK